LSTPTALVLGASGFIGRHVCAVFAQQGFRVHGVGHGHWARDEWARWGLSRWVSADIHLESLGEAAAGSAPRALVHCAGSGSVAYSYAAPLDDYHRSVSSTAALLEFARQHGSDHPRVVVASSAAVYGDQGEVDLAESATRSPMSPYGFNKTICENVCDSYSRFFSVQTSIVRLFSVYGEGLRKQLLWDAMNKFSRGESQFFGTGHEFRDWIHVDDAARLLCMAAVAPQAPFEIYNGAHTKATTREVLTRLGHHSVPALEPHFNGETHAGNPRRLTANWGRARSQLGWEPQVELGTGLARYAEWFHTLSAP
jgi:UDP-glucose 4-epimerase